MSDIGSARYPRNTPAIPTSGDEVRFLPGRSTAIVYTDKGNFIYGQVKGRDCESIMHHLRLRTQRAEGYIVSVGDGYLKDNSWNYEAEVLWWLV